MSVPSSLRVRGWFIFAAYVSLLAFVLSRWGEPTSLSPAPRSFTRGESPHGVRGGEGSIAVLDIQGPIAFSMGGGFGREGGVDGALRRLRDLQGQAEVKAVILRINSPGGTVASVQELHAAILALKKSGKKIVASFQDVAASGGYYVAAPADRIVANPGSIVGSIGVIFHLNNVQELARKVGIKSEVIKSGFMKDLGSMTRALTAEERRVFEGLVQSAFNQFLAAVSDGRKMPMEKLRPLADGRVFTGEQALAVGLVDVLGGFDQAVEEARMAAGLRSKKPRLLLEEKPWARLFHLLKGRAEPWERLSQWMEGRASLEYVWR